MEGSSFFFNFNDNISLEAIFMKHLLTFALSLAVVCSLGLPAFADYGKGGNGKSATTNGPKTKHPKVKPPQTTTPTDPTNPTTPPVITRQPVTLNKGVPLNKNATILAAQNLVKKNVAGKPASDARLTKDFGQDKAPQNQGPFPPDFHCGTNTGNNNNDCHNGHCHDGHCGNGGNGGHHNPPPIDPGKGDGKPTPPSQPNPPARPGYVWVPANGNVPGHWERERAPTTTPTKPGYVWVPATATVPGHWERARAK